MQVRLSRRTVLAAVSVAGCASVLNDGNLPPQGVETPSDSVMLSLADPEQGVQVTARLCRYPDYRMAWLWAHAHTPDGSFAFVDHNASCSEGFSAEDSSVASYADDAARLHFERIGPTLSPERGASRVSVCDDSGVEMRCALEIVPTLLRPGLLPGRMEAFGHVVGEVRIGSRTWRVSGAGQFHEQRQTTPRFTTPFTFATLWSERMAGTLLAIPGQSSGYLLTDDGAPLSGSVRFDPPGAHRRLALEGDALSGVAEVLHAYTIPIYGQAWRGAFVRVQTGAGVLFGALNDWRPDLLYSA
ncbi:MAG: hypothetical protein R3C27_01220 [Hyphomonadaceae bacterium]